MKKERTNERNTMEISCIASNSLTLLGSGFYLLQFDGCNRAKSGISTNLNVHSRVTCSISSAPRPMSAFGFLRHFLRERCCCPDGGDAVAPTGGDPSGVHRTSIPDDIIPYSRNSMILQQKMKGDLNKIMLRKLNYLLCDGLISRCDSIHPDSAIR